MPEAITEAMGVHKAWYEDAKVQTVDTLPEFMRHLAEDYQHDYGTICHALAAVAIGAAWAMERTPQGGITGFQAGAVMWEFIRHWNHSGDNPMRLIDFGDLLYPQCSHKFVTISSETWAWAQERAKTLLAEGRGVPDVRAHWQSVANGVVPFGLTVDA